MGEKLLQATCIFTKIKLQIIASLLYEIGAHFGQYFGYLSQKLDEDPKKRSSRQIGADFGQYQARRQRGAGGAMPPDFRFCSPDLFLPPPR